MSAFKRSHVVIMNRYIPCTRLPALAVQLTCLRSSHSIMLPTHTRLTISFAFIALTTALVGAFSPSSSQNAAITLNPNVRYQVMHRWEGVAAGGPSTFSSLSDPQIAQAVDRAVNDLNLTRVRLEITNGAEGGTGNSGRYSPVNDNGDPNVLNIGAFDFSSLDHAIDRIVIPLRQSAAATGKTIYLKLHYIDHLANTAFEHWRDP